MDAVVKKGRALHDKACGAEGVGELGYMVIFHTVPLPAAPLKAVATDENIARTWVASSGS
jgi:hypothetical protein